MTAFEKEDGLAGNEFNRAHKFTFPDGRITFGDIDGFSIFNPAEFDQKEINHNVPFQIISLQINNLFLGPDNAGSIIQDP